MATTQLLVRTTMTRIHDPGLAMEEVNKQLCTQAFRGQFVTMLLMVVNPKDGAVEIASAGHPAQLLDKGGCFEPLEMGITIGAGGWMGRRSIRRNSFVWSRGRRCFYIRME